MNERREDQTIRARRGEKYNRVENMVPFNRRAGGGHIDIKTETGATQGTTISGENCLRCRSRRKRSRGIPRASYLEPVHNF